MMKNVKLDYSSLEKAVSTLSIALQSYEANSMVFSLADRDIIRDGVIQRFEYTFELAWKTLKRYLEIYGLEKADTLTNRDLFRIGAEQGLIDDPASWFNYMIDRNRTSHSYDADVANDVFHTAGQFLHDVTYLLDQLKKRVI
jgi:nucleotidyltransferase substrate binding protein (TIGR01987 family)